MKTLTFLFLILITAIQARGANQVGSIATAIAQTPGPQPGQQYFVTTPVPGQSGNYIYGGPTLGFQGYFTAPILSPTPTGTWNTPTPTITPTPTSTLLPGTNTPTPGYTPSSQPSLLDNPYKNLPSQQPLMQIGDPYINNTGDGNVPSLGTIGKNMLNPYNWSLTNTTNALAYVNLILGPNWIQNIDESLAYPGTSALNNIISQLTLSGTGNTCCVTGIGDSTSYYGTGSLYLGITSFSSAAQMVGNSAGWLEGFASYPAQFSGALTMMVGYTAGLYTGGGTVGGMYGFWSIDQEGGSYANIAYQSDEAPGSTNYSVLATGGATASYNNQVQMTGLAFIPPYTPTPGASFPDDNGNAPNLPPAVTPTVGITGPVTQFITGASHTPTPSVFNYFDGVLMSHTP